RIVSRRPLLGRLARLVAATLAVPFAKPQLESLAAALVPSALFGDTQGLGESGGGLVLGGGACRARFLERETNAFGLRRGQFPSRRVQLTRDLLAQPIRQRRERAPQLVVIVHG